MNMNMNNLWIIWITLMFFSEWMEIMRILNIYCLVYFSKMNESLMCLERHEGEYMMTEFSICVWTIISSGSSLSYLVCFFYFPYPCYVVFCENLPVSILNNLSMATVEFCNGKNWGCCETLSGFPYLKELFKGLCNTLKLFP